jgi:hypothetical protein
MANLWGGVRGGYMHAGVVRRRLDLDLDHDRQGDSRTICVW